MKLMWLICRDERGASADERRQFCGENLSVKIMLLQFPQIDIMTAASSHATGSMRLCSADIARYSLQATMEEKILTRHPEGKQGVNISRQKYDHIKDAILRVLHERGEIAFKDLPEAVADQLAGVFEGRMMWYVVTVKLDLEARGLIERVPKKTPQRVRLAVTRSTRPKVASLKTARHRSRNVHPRKKTEG